MGVKSKSLVEENTVMEGKRVVRVKRDGVGATTGFGCTANDENAIKRKIIRRKNSFAMIWEGRGSWAARKRIGPTVNDESN